MKIKATILFMADLVNIVFFLPGNNGPLLRAVGQHHNVSLGSHCVCWSSWVCLWWLPLKWSVIKDNPLPVFTLCHISGIGLLYILLSSRKHISPAEKPNNSIAT